MISSWFSVINIKDLIPHMTYFHWFHIWPPEVIDIWRPNAIRIIYGQKWVSEWNQNTKKLWFDTSYDISIFSLWRIMSKDNLDTQAGNNFWSLNKGFQKGIRTPKNLWFDASHTLFSLVSYFNLQMSANFEGHNLQNDQVKKGFQNGIRTLKIKIWYLTWPIFID